MQVLKVYAGEANAGAVMANLKAADLHEEVARWHRVAAGYFLGHDLRNALRHAEKAYLRCNHAFDATISAHWVSGEITPVDPEL